LRWPGTVGAPVAWQIIETWTGTVEAPAVWQLIETWTGTIEAPVLWKLIETWAGTVEAPAAWQFIETWTGTVEAPAVWQLIETWTGTVEAPAEWQLIETWTGTVEAPLAWQLIETWTGTVEAHVAWQLIETWTGTVEATAAWQLIETWTGTVETPAAWQLIESWTGVVETIGVSSSSVDAILPYWQTSTPLVVAATASDPDGYVENVEFFYRYRENPGVSWGSWTSFGLDNENFDGWSWSFTGSDGYYEFYSIARDNDGNVEFAPAEADAQCGVDTVAPIITSIVINDNDNLTSSTSVTLSTDASDVTSGLAKMRFSTDNVDWSDWQNFAASKSYTLPTGDGLKTVYVQVKDKAGWVSTIASDSITLETIPPPPEGALIVTIGTIRAGEIGLADFTQYGIAVTKVRITPEHDVSGVEVYVVVHAVKPAGVPTITLPVYSYFDITTTIDAAEVRRATIEFQVPGSWITQNNIDESTVRLLRYSGGWQALPTSFVGADSIYLRYEATTSGFMPFAVVGERMVTPPVTPPLVVVPPPSPIMPVSTPVLPVFFTLLAIFSVGISALALYHVLTWRLRPFVPLKVLKRVISTRPAITLARLRIPWRIKPTISLERLVPAPMTLAPALPVGPLKPVPIVTRLPVSPRRVVTRPMAPTEILKRLKRGRKPAKPKIPLERMRQIAEPLAPCVSLDSLKRVARPLEPVITIEGLKWAGRPVERIIRKRPKRAARPMKPHISLKRLKEAARPLLKPRVLPERRLATWGEEPKPFLERLKREVFKEKKRGRRAT